MLALEIQSKGIKSRIRTLAGAVLVTGLTAAPALAVQLTAEDVQDRAAIEEAMSHYMYALDMANPDAFAAVFSPDGEMVINGQPLAKGHDALQKFVAGLRNSWKITDDKTFGKTRHIYYNFTVDIQGDKAEGHTYWQTLIADPNGAAAWKVLDTGTSQDSFVKIDGGWFIAKRVITADPATQKPAQIK